MNRSQTLYYNLKLILGVVILLLTFFSCSKDVDEPKEEPNTGIEFYFGADMSSVNMVEDYGAEYKDNGLIADPFTIFKNHGCNLVRVRLFHNPDAANGYSQYYKPGYCGLNDVTKTIQRAKDNGMEVCLDFHYSDTWADPGNQIIPLAWQGLSLEVLKDSLYNYTLSVFNSLKNKNLTPEMVQIGNEIDPGILLPTGKSNAALATLLNSGIKAIRDFSVNSDIKPKIIIQYADNKNAVNRFTNLQTAGVHNYDIIGISYYDQWADIKFSELSSVISQLKTKFNKEVMVVETAYQWTNASRDGKVYTSQVQLNGYPVTKEGQYKYMKTLTEHVIAGGGSGIIYWEPAWSKSSIGWGIEIRSMFDFNGNVLPAINYMSDTYTK